MFQSSPGVNCRGFLKRAAQPSKALEIELVKKLSNMTFRKGFLIFLQASNGCKEIKMYFFINVSINSSSDFFINIHIFTSLRTTEQQRHRTASSKMPSCCIRTHNEHACSKHPNVPADDICK